MDHASNPSSPVLLVCILAFVSVLALKGRLFKRSQSLPPGPKGLPWLGPLAQIPQGDEWKTFHKWCSEYKSSLVSFSVLGRTMIVADTLEMAIELFEQRSGIYSSRPNIPMMDLINMTNTVFSLEPYTDEWRKRRRLFHEVIREQTTSHFCPCIQEATSKLLLNLLRTPEDFVEHITMFGACVLFSSTYGSEATESAGLSVGAWQQFPEMAAAAGPGAYLVNIVPVLKYVPSWMPGAGFQRHASKHANTLENELVKKPYEIARQRLLAGRLKPSFISYALQDIDASNLDHALDQRIQRVATTIMAGGTETTSSTLTSFVLAMVLNPSVQQRAFQEIRSVCGPDRLPSYDEDREYLPYFSATVMENFRWAPALPLGVPHNNVSDDVYGDYYIPSGSTLFANIWAMSRNEEIYPNPETFDPERFLKDGSLDKSICDPTNFIFGFGRRICPGRYLALASNWTVAASLLATFQFSKHPDEDVGPKFESGLTMHPSPFKCLIKPRDAQAEKLILDAADQA